MPPVDFPYPPSPVNVPEGYTDYSDEYRSQQRKLTVGVVFFLLFYLIAVVSSSAQLARSTSSTRPW